MQMSNKNQDHQDYTKMAKTRDGLYTLLLAKTKDVDTQRNKKHQEKMAATRQKHQKIIHMINDNDASKLAKLKNTYSLVNSKLEWRFLSKTFKRGTLVFIDTKTTLCGMKVSL